MPVSMLAKRGSLLGLVLVLAASAYTLAQVAGRAEPAAAAAKPVTFEYTQRDVQTDQMVDSANDLGKQGWEVFQAMPVWHFENTEIRPVRYILFAKRHVRD